MSDQGFDEDLRSVLLEDAPREVPDDLRRRVAAVPVTNPAPSRPFRPAWRRPVLLWTGALAAIVVVLTVVSLRFGPAPGAGVGGVPSPSSSDGASAATTGTRSTSAPPSTSVSACRAVDVQGRILGWQGAAGSRIADVEVSNVTASPCFVRGTPGLQLVDGSGHVLIDSATAGPSGQPHIRSADATFELTPGGRLRTEVQASNYCGSAASPPIDIALTLPSGGGRLVATPGAGVSSADAVPPCLGSTGAVITMNGWRR
jgi:hypothetical protein